MIKELTDSSSSHALLEKSLQFSPTPAWRAQVSRRGDFVPCFVKRISKGHAPLFPRTCLKKICFLEHSLEHWLPQFKNLWKYDWDLREDSEFCSLKEDFESLGWLQIGKCLGTCQDEQYMNPYIHLFMPTPPSCYRVLLI